MSRWPVPSLVTLLALGGCQVIAGLNDDSRERYVDGGEPGSAGTGLGTAGHPSGASGSQAVGGAAGSNGGAAGSSPAGAAGANGGAGGTAITDGGTGGTAIKDGAAEAPPPMMPMWPPPGMITLTSIGAFTLPLFVTGKPGSAGDVFVVEKGGKIFLVVKGAQPTPFLDVSTLVDTVGERGLLGLAFHPSYPQNGRLYIYYVNTGGNLVLAEYLTTGGVSPTAVKTFFTIAHTQAGGNPANLNGGMLAFGTDGYLYVGVGDGGGGGDVDNNAQNLNVRLGKILRIDVEKYPIAPAGNMVGGDDQIWDYGLRNPWRFSFDRLTHDLYIADVGLNTSEELDVEAPGTGRKNYGWRITEGDKCFNAASCDMTGLTAPTLAYDHAEGLAIIGGYVYRGTAIPQLYGTYVFADYMNSKVWGLQWSNGAIVHAKVLLSFTGGTVASPTSLGEDTAGELYICNAPGAVYRLSP